MVKNPQMKITKIDWTNHEVSPIWHYSSKWFHISCSGFCGRTKQQCLQLCHFAAPKCIFIFIRSQWKFNSAFLFVLIHLYFIDKKHPSIYILVTERTKSNQCHVLLYQIKNKIITQRIDSLCNENVVYNTVIFAFNFLSTKQYYVFFLSANICFCYVSPLSVLLVVCRFSFLVYFCLCLCAIYSLPFIPLMQLSHYLCLLQILDMEGAKIFFYSTN